MAKQALLRSSGFLVSYWVKPSLLTGLETSPEGINKAECVNECKQTHVRERAADIQVWTSNNEAGTDSQRWENNRCIFKSAQHEQILWVRVMKPTQPSVYWGSERKPTGKWGEEDRKSHKINVKCVRFFEILQCQTKYWMFFPPTYNQMVLMNQSAKS